VDVEGLSPVECFVWSDRVEELPVCLGLDAQLIAVPEFWERAPNLTGCQ
jgi:hypothetical protein